jgi:hypothetical protein
MGFQYGTHRFWEDLAFGTERGLIQDSWPQYDPYDRILNGIIMDGADLWTYTAAAGLSVYPPRVAIQLVPTRGDPPQ